VTEEEGAENIEYVVSDFETHGLSQSGKIISSWLLVTETLS